MKGSDRVEAMLTRALPHLQIKADEAELLLRLCADIGSSCRQKLSEDTLLRRRRIVRDLSRARTHLNYPTYQPS